MVNVKKHFHLQTSELASIKEPEPETDFLEDFQTSEEIGSLIERMLTADDLETDLSQIFTSKSELELGIELSNRLLEAIRDFASPGH